MIQGKCLGRTVSIEEIHHTQQPVPFNNNRSTMHFVDHRGGFVKNAVASFNIVPHFQQCHSLFFLAPCNKNKAPKHVFVEISAFQHTIWNFNFANLSKQFKKQYFFSALLKATLYVVPRNASFAHMQSRGDWQGVPYVFLHEVAVLIGERERQRDTVTDSVTGLSQCCVDHWVVCEKQRVTACVWEWAWEKGDV